MGRLRTLLRTGFFAVFGRPAFRIALFSTLCIVYTFSGRAALAGCWHTRPLSRLRFLRLVIGQFRSEGLSVTSFRRQALVSQPYIVDPSDERSLKQDPIGRLWLYFADGLKVEGFFADAEQVYRGIVTRHRSIADMALTGIGDIFLLQAIWSREYQAYYDSNIALNPLSHLIRETRSATWHDRSSAEAAEILEQALKLNPRNKDALWLLANVESLEDRWADALRHSTAVAALSGRTLEVLFQEARTVFAFDPEEGRRLYADLTGRNWRTSVRTLATSLELVDEPCLLRHALHEEACTLDIRTHLVTRGQCVDIEHSVEFDRRYLYEYADAEILPRYGMLSIADRWLLTDSAHVKRPHWPVFTTGLAAIAKDSALICTNHPHKLAQHRAIYIGNNNNFFHWIVEELPRLKSVLQDPRYHDVPVLVPNDAAPWQLDLLTRLGVTPSRHLPADFSRPLQVSHLVSPPRLAKDLVVHPSAVRFLRDKLVPNHSKLKVRKGKRLYLHRGNAVGRAMLNEAEVVSRFLATGFALVDPGQMTIDQQIELFKDAEVIAGPGGAAFANIIWAPAGVKVVALASDDILTETFSSIAAALGQEYWLCTGPSFPRSHRRWIWTRFNFALDLDDVDACLASVLGTLRDERIDVFKNPEEGFRVAA